MASPESSGGRQGPARWSAIRFPIPGAVSRARHHEDTRAATADRASTPPWFPVVASLGREPSRLHLSSVTELSEPLAGRHIAHFGHHDPHYSRNRIMAKALTLSGADVTQIADPRTFLWRTPRLLRRVAHEDFDAILVGFPSHSDVPVARAVARSKGIPTLFDPLTSLWENAVIDRQAAARRSVAAATCWMYDSLSCRLADLVLLDTQAHIDFFCDRFGLGQSKFRRVWVGSDEQIMKPREPPPHDDEFVVFFYGSFRPFQGVDCIVRAAHVLEQRREGVRFILCGDGPTYDGVRSLGERLGTTTVEFVQRRSIERLADLIAGSHVCLGVFGTNAKALRVIPNKVFDALACRRPVITGDAPAIRELLTDREDVWLCRLGDEEALADALTTLRRDRITRDRIAHGGHALFRRRLSTKALAPEIGEIVRDTIERSSRPVNRATSRR
jgi:glycosyltransferase involved in cell wall biosynthesis